MDVAIGVDTHKSTLEVAVLDAQGRPQGARRFKNDARGHADVKLWISNFGRQRVVGIECSGTFGAALARQLLAAR